MRPDKKQSIDLSFVVGRFAEQIARTLVDSSDCDKEIGDFVSRDAKMGFDVKAGSSKHPYRIRIEQLLKHYGNRGNGTFHDFVYCLMAYKRMREGYDSRKGDRRHSAFRSCKTAEEVNLKILKNGLRVYFLDIEFVMALYESIGCTKGVFRGRKDDPHLCINESLLLSIVERGTDELQKLELDPRQWLIQTMRVHLPLQGDLFIKHANISVQMIAEKKLSRKLSTIIFPFGACGGEDWGEGEEFAAENDDPF